MSSSCTNLGTNHASNRRGSTRCASALACQLEDKLVHGSSATVLDGWHAALPQGSLSSDSWDAAVQLPGGYTTTRRSALKAIALAGALGSVYVLLTRAKVGNLSLIWHTLK
jgi:hypothetical protein